MQTLLVTGGAGFIGGTFVRQTLAQSDVRIINLDSLTYAGNLQSLESVRDHRNHIFVKGDIGNRALVRSLLEQYECDAIVNFAAESHVDRSIGCPANFLRTNVLGTFELLEAALDYWESDEGILHDSFRFLHVSTDEVYGSLGASGKFVETTAYAPNSPYSASKAASDHFVRAYHHTYGLPVLITNCSNNFGPYQHPEKLIPLTIVNALEGKPLPIYGTGENIRDWLHVEDHCRALWMILERGKIGEVYNIGGNCELTNLQVVRKICGAIDGLNPDLPHRPCASLLQFVTDRPGHDYRYAIDCSKIEAELAWKPIVDFDSGIEQTVRWYMENMDWAQGETARRSRSERMGLKRQPEAAEREAMASNGHGRPLPEAESESCEWTRVAKGEAAAIDGVVFRSLVAHNDERGWLVELFRQDEIPAENAPAMAYVSQTMPGVARGPHEHVEQADFFGFVGPGDFQLILWDDRASSLTFGEKLVTVVGESNPQSVLVPPGVVHAYRNISSYPGWVFNAPNRLYAGEGKREPVDEIRHEDVEDSPYALDELVEA